ncbi:MAG: hypothetical protein H7296_07845 [Bacteroidia bacterium]|nr:hypothetical protein [Bacteroidia bacterium]
MIVLLDIDGVMVSGASWKLPKILADGFADFNPKAVSNLQKIISTTKATIVLTTSHKSRFSGKEWGDIFKKRGINANIKKLHSNSALSQNRKEEILKWVQENANEELFVIIDDDKSLNALPKSIKEKLVLVSSLIGLNEDSARQAIDILNSSRLEEVH